MALNSFSNTASSNAFVYTDLQGLESIKRQAGSDEEGALRAVAEQFESMFTQMIMKSMREATKTLNPDSFLSSYETEFYEQMLDEQMSLNMSQQGGMGLADALYQQLSSQAQRAKGGNGSPDVLPLDRHGRAILPATLRAPESNTLPSVTSPGDTELLESLSSMSPESNLTAEQKQALFNTPEDFVAAVMPHAAAVAEEMNADPRYLVAQAALETGWGRHVISRADGDSSHNLFNIKADHRWSGDRATVTTKEYLAGRPVNVQAAFRAYESLDHSFADYRQFLSSSPRYAEALAVADDGAAYVEALQAAGYATDPQYAEKIQRIAQSPMMDALFHQTLAVLGEQP